MNTFDPDSGRSYPLGATVNHIGTNFSIFSRSATAVELLLFNYVDDIDAATVIRLSPERNKTFYYWHVFVPGVKAGQLYAFRVYGPFDPKNGHRFNENKILLDPYSRAVMLPQIYSRQAAIGPADNTAMGMKSVVVDLADYDWEGDSGLKLPYSRSVIYELHIGSFTKHPSSGVSAEKKGTYLGLIEKIPYLQELGIKTIELMPVQQFDVQDAPLGKINYWGYSPIAFFAPHRGYTVNKNDPLAPIYEFRDMVKALHKAGIEVILDVVFNHTAEGNQLGPSISFRGLENNVYYILDPKDLSVYANYSGCGNTINTNHYITRQLILNCLRYWVTEMHVDGFRFDLASVMARGETGEPLENPPILWEIESDPVLAGVKIIAEAWDAAGLFQVGSFIGHRWAEWNSHFRDDARRFAKGCRDTVSALANRIVGSPDLYIQPGREPNRSINFIACHDGFTLNDLVSYDKKHNEANGEKNRDGTNNNDSWNCGAEGESDNPEIERLRLKQIKNFFALLFVAQGTPMIQMGDEIRRTQRGNNNAFCQDNEISWMNWEGVKTHAGLFRFVKRMIAYSQTDTIFREESFWTQPDSRQSPRIAWHGVQLHQPDFSSDSHSIAFELYHANENKHYFIIMNAYWKKLTFQLPHLPPGKVWQRFVDTSLPSPNDICEHGSTPLVLGSEYDVEDRSVVILIA